MSNADALNAWQKELKFDEFLKSNIAPKGFEAIVRSALAMVRESEKLLSGNPSGSPWMLSNWADAKRAVENWLLCPCQDHAKVAYEQARLGEKQADAACEASTDRGDWWSAEAVLTAHQLCEAIALEAGFPEAFPDDPHGFDPSEAALAVCHYFAFFPSNVERTIEKAKAVVMGCFEDEKTDGASV